MIKSAQRNGNFLPAGILFLSAAMIGLLFYQGVVDPLPALIAFALLPAVLYLLFFNRRLFLPITVFLIPLSINTDMGNGTVTDFPAEPLIGIMALGMLVHELLYPSLRKSV